jgi:hypothetical protein
MTNEAEQFFYEHAGWSHDPKTETSKDGRKRNALNLAAAEAWAYKEGLSFDWNVDDIDSSFFSDEQPFRRLWACALVYPNNEMLGCIGGVDLAACGPDAYYSDPYQRVIEAELALAAMREAERAQQASEARVLEG